jgi:perosamine synthetase
MVVTNDKTLNERSRHLKGQGLATHREYWHDVVGYNYRMTNIQCAIGLAQLERADDFLSRKREIAFRYAQKLKGLPIEMHHEAIDTVHSYWMVSILVDQAEHREPLREHLRLTGIETRPLFYPAHTMPMHSRNFRRHPVAEDLSWRGINLPSWPGLSNAQVDHIAAVVRSYFNHAV